MRIEFMRNKNARVLATLRRSRRDLDIAIAELESQPASVSAATKKRLHIVAQMPVEGMTAEELNKLLKSFNVSPQVIGVWVRYGYVLPDSANKYRSRLERVYYPPNQEA